MARLTVAMMMLALVVSAQQKPNFSGRWAIVSPKAGVGYEQIVKQDDKSLSVELVGDPGQRQMYQLDGVERRMASSHGADVTIMARAAWEKNTIVITTNMSYSNRMRTVLKDVWSMDAQGRLVIDSSETGPAGPANTNKVIYVKKS